MEIPEHHCALGLKVNLPIALTRDVNEENPLDPTTYCQFSDWDFLKEEVLQPFLDYLDTETNKKPRMPVHHWSAGIHTNGKNDIPHVHFNLHVENVPKSFNFLTNYKYYYLHTYIRQRMGLPKSITEISKIDLMHDKVAHYFKNFKHSIKTSYMEDVKGWLAYPFKEVIDHTQNWKGAFDCKIQPYLREDLVALGSGIYLASINQKLKTQAKEDLKLEKWGDFCAYMDAFAVDHPSMRDLRGITLVALDYFRAKPDRTSVNAVITMCKDYAFKRGIWTNDQILDKYQIA